MHRKLILFLGLLFMFFGGVSYCAEEQITLTTYYPSPYGVYSVMRFFPRTLPTVSNEGDVYYDSIDRILKYYDGTAWVDIGEPRGTIILWSGAVANIPSGWALCDGLTHSGIATPNLMDRFVVGAGSSYSVNDTGGSASIALGLNELPQHLHANTILVSATTRNSGAHTHSYQDEATDTPCTGLGGAGGQCRGSENTRTTAGVSVEHNHAVDVSASITNANAGNPAASIDKRPPYYALCYIMKL